MRSAGSVATRAERLGRVGVWGAVVRWGGRGLGDR